MTTLQSSVLGDGCSAARDKDHGNCSSETMTSLGGFSIGGSAIPLDGCTIFLWRDSKLYVSETTLRQEMTMFVEMFKGQMVIVWFMVVLKRRAEIEDNLFSSFHD